MIWLGANSDFNVNMDVPVVMFLPQERMEQIYYKEQEKHGDLHAFYDTDHDTIVLPDTWDRREPWDLSVLLHEIIHYVQDQNEIQFNCTGRWRVRPIPYSRSTCVRFMNLIGIMTGCGTT